MLVNRLSVNRRAGAAALTFVLVVSATMFVWAVPVAAEEPYETMIAADPLGAARYVVASAYHEGKIYIAGGYPVGGWPMMDSTLIYDVETGATAFGPNMPHGTDAPFYTQLPDGRLFVMGGFNATTSVQIFDPVAEEWTETVNPIPTGIAWGPAAAGANGLIYCFGGWPNMNSTYVYDPETDSWHYGADVPIPVRAATALAYKPDAIYVMGGYNTLGAVQNAVQVYDPLTDTWSSASPMTVGVSHAVSTVARNGYVYVFGGTNGVFSNDPAVATIQRYDVASDAWDYAGVSLSEPRGGYPGLATDGYGRVFVLGGFNGVDATASVDMLLMSSISGTSEVQIVSPTDGSIVSGIVPVNVNMKNNLGWWRAAADLFVDGALYETQTAGIEWWFMWDTTGLPDGSVHTLLARVYGYDGSVAEASVSVTVSALSTEEKIAALEDQISALGDQIAAVQDQLSDQISAVDNRTDDLEAQLVALEAMLEDLSDEVDVSNSTQSAKLQDLEDALASLEEQLTALQEGQDNVKTSADSSITWGMVNLGLLIVVIVLLALMFVMSRKGKAPPPPST